MSKGMDVSKLNEFLAGGKRDKDVPVVAQDKRCDCGCCQDSAGSEAGIAAPAVALTDAGGKVSSKKCAGKAKKYLDMVNSKDAAVDLTKLALSGWKNPVSPSLRPIQQPKAKHRIYPFIENSLEEHDKRWHGGHYDGGACKYREQHGIPTTKKGVDTGAKADDLKGSEKGANKGHYAHPRKMYPYVKKQFPGDKIEKSLADIIQKHVHDDYQYDVKNAFPDGVPNDVISQYDGLIKYYSKLHNENVFNPSTMNIGKKYGQISRELNNAKYDKQYSDAQQEAKGFTDKQLDDFMEEMRRDEFFAHKEDYCEAEDRPSWELDDYYADYSDEVHRNLMDYDPCYRAYSEEVDSRAEAD